MRMYRTFNLKQTDETRFQSGAKSWTFINHRTRIKTFLTYCEQYRTPSVNFGWKTFLRQAKKISY